jgi:hypothetical protein
MLATEAEAVRQLRLIQSREFPAVQAIITARDEVYNKYQRLFSATNIPSVTGEEFREFLLPKNSHHWTSLYRQGGENLRRYERPSATSPTVA